MRLGIFPYDCESYVCSSVKCLCLLFCHLFLLLHKNCYIFCSHIHLKLYIANLYLLYHLFTILNVSSDNKVLKLNIVEFATIYRSFDQ